MKIVEKKPAVIAYICEKCNTEYEHETDAEKCEKYHVGVVGFTTKEYVESDSKYPNSMGVRMQDGTVQTYMVSFSTPNDIIQNVTNSDGAASLALVDSYEVTVKKEYTQDDEVKVELLRGVNIELKDGKLYVNVPDSIAVTSDDTLCVKVIDKNGNEITKETEGSPFNDIIITAEVTQIVENDCKEETEDPENTEETE